MSTKAPKWHGPMCSRQRSGVHVVSGRCHGIDYARLSPAQAICLPVTDACYVMVKSRPLKRYITFPTPEPRKGILHGNRVSADVMS